MSIPIKPNSPELAIALTSTTCRPSGTIVGSIQRILPVVAPEATLTVQLVGYTEAKVYDRLNRHQAFSHEPGNYSSNQYDFFSTNGPVEQKLHSGPLHVQEVVSHGSSR